jgi:hypothetical protein
MFVDGLFFLASVVERLKYALDVKFFQFSVQFRKTQIEANKQGTFDAV